MSTEQKQTETTHQTTTPWAPQAGALSTAFDGALDAYGRAKGATAPTDFISQFTPEQLATFRNALGYANNNTSASSNATAGTALSNAGVGATTGALSGLSSFDPSAANNPQALIGAANKYADGQDINSKVDASMLAARQNARDVIQPGIEANAATTGNTNSSRTGIRMGLVDRGLGEQAASLGASLRSDAFKDGLSLASSNANANNASRLGALSTEANAGTNAASTGIGANSQSINDQKNLFGIANDGGTGLQNSQQAYLDNIIAQYKQKVSGSYDPLQGLMSIIGSQNWGGTTDGTGTKTTTPSTMQTISGLLGAAGGAASMAGGLGWKPFS